MENLQYPIGRFLPKEVYSVEAMAQIIKVLETTTAQYRELVERLPAAELAKTYRTGSWTVRQLVHHVADIQLLNFLRLKKALTEDGYEATLVQMDAWAATPDATSAPVADSLLMLDGISRRFAFLASRLDEQALAISFYHPLRKVQLNLKQALHMAVWHLEHHRGHIELALGLPVHPFTLQ